MSGTRRRAGGSWLVATALAVVAAACAPPAPPDTVQLHFGHGYDPSAPHHACGAEPLPDLLDEADVGLDMIVYPAGQLGTSSRCSNSSSPATSS